MGRAFGEVMSISTSPRAALCPLLFLLAACSGNSAPSVEDTSKTGSPASSPVSAGATSKPARPMVQEEIPAAFLGVWDALTGTCDPASDLRMEIGPRAIGYYESHGEVTRVEVDNPSRIVVSLAMEGEGEKWQMAQMLTLSEGGRRLTPAAVSEEAETERLPLKRCDPEE